MSEVFLLLGSNLGDRYSFLNKAVKAIEDSIAPVIKTSSLYETKAWGINDQPDFLNQVVVIDTRLTARQVLNKILAIELSLGRQRDIKWGPRTIDIDILFYGNSIIKEPDLEIPHPRLHERRFTIEPLVELAPQFVHPILRKTVSQLKNELKDSLIVKKL